MDAQQVAEEIGQLADMVDSILVVGQIPMPADEADVVRKAALRRLRYRLRTLSIKAGGEDHWEGRDD